MAASGDEVEMILMFELPVTDEKVAQRCRVITDTSRTTINDAIDIRYRPVGGPPRKVSIRPRTDGGWLRVTLKWNGCRWRETGCEAVTDVGLECADGVVIGE